MEVFTSEEDESRAARLGQSSRSVKRVVSDPDGSLRSVEETPDVARPQVEEALALQDVLRIRAVCYTLLNLCSFDSSSC